MYRPSCTEGQTSLVKETVEKTVNSWLQSTTDILNLNLSKSLELITSVKTLQTIREEAFKLGKSLISFIFNHVVNNAD